MAKQKNSPSNKPEKSFNQQVEEAKNEAIEKAEAPSDDVESVEAQPHDTGLEVVVALVGSIAEIATAFSENNKEAQIHKANTDLEAEKYKADTNKTISLWSILFKVFMLAIIAGLIIFLAANDKEESSAMILTSVLVGALVTGNVVKLIGAVMPSIKGKD